MNLIKERARFRRITVSVRATTLAEGLSWAANDVVAIPLAD